eukprot:GHUV01026774.1.p1 GENE.GHUV01026774.1~~GHUV01026774.1.p1  ORF type:complete len:227 (+),score=34.70 GHUV01026774.1:477-1157(+)
MDCGTQVQMLMLSTAAVPCIYLVESAQLVLHHGPLISGGFLYNYRDLCTNVGLPPLSSTSMVSASWWVLRVTELAVHGSIPASYHQSRTTTVTAGNFCCSLTWLAGGTSAHHHLLCGRVAKKHSLCPYNVAQTLYIAAGAMSLGDVSWHHGWTLHGAAPQPPGTPQRLAIAVSFFADGARLLARNSDPSVYGHMLHDEDAESYGCWLKDMKDGALARHTMLPVVYS